MARAGLFGYSAARVEQPRQAAGSGASVSVVIPCYNYGHYLPTCVKSVLDQPGVDVDILIIDDASPDGSAGVVQRIAAGQARVRGICHAENKGHIATYNEGLSQVSGKYAVLLSADDLLTPGSLARATALMEAHPSVGLTYGFSVDFTDDGPPPARTAATSWTIWAGHDWIADRCKTGRNVLRSPEAVMRTSVLRSVGGYRADLPHSGDFEMWMRAATTSDVGYVGGADQAYYRVHQNNMHHSIFDLHADVAERVRAFDSVFAERSSLLADAQHMSQAAHRALGREALGHAISAYARGVADTEPVDDFAALAMKTWPDAGQLREWRVLRRLRERDGRQPRWDPSARAREAARNLTYSFRWWRRRWSGAS